MISVLVFPLQRKNSFNAKPVPPILKLYCSRNLARTIEVNYTKTDLHRWHEDKNAAVLCLFLIQIAELIKHLTVDLSLSRQDSWPLQSMFALLLVANLSEQKANFNVRQPPKVWLISYDNYS